MTYVATEHHLLSFLMFLKVCNACQPSPGQCGTQLSDLRFFRPGAEIFVTKPQLFRSDRLLHCINKDKAFIDELLYLLIWERVYIAAVGRH